MKMVATFDVTIDTRSLWCKVGVALCRIGLLRLGGWLFERGVVLTNGPVREEVIEP